MTFRHPCRNISSKSLYQSLENMYGSGNFDVDVEQNVFVVTVYES
ncbi:uncharacterized protein PODANS_7_3140 [Podospora anserina S mat+]|uniref:Podospora anserina S mat+ genomic DNA chromosome 7, supercontig 1 n=1 Tax=Podospora anserina (strain S / ATCC MYA-4624 / DSM 980 / FGSC 10383) TaxID=515849 RepID=B2AVF3_PODAN|nr:uncharacterized protein PODANS_7_3140 [Podospora anserina S mat+]CAP68377.1 unnamed protein product [Podospora anserina S mat+]CDP31848.1 Putative protein of unknown function [Podospora anserina S mat+]